ncbi:MAG: glyoxylate/hydroxypyruvate reductase A [Methylobacteriaceae bacterium]|nr:glyoxylate/hydroxypyruvate reductase A [Methylobacteriaceae bacterium]
MSILLVGEFGAEEYARWRENLAACLAGDEILRLATDKYDPASIEIALVANPPAGSLVGLRNLRLIQSLWAGVDRLLSDATVPAHVPIVRLIDPNLTQAMTECALACVMFLHRQFPAYAEQQATREWKKRPQTLARQRRVGILGFGQLGQAVAAALASLNFDVEAWSARSHSFEGIRTRTGQSGLAALLERSDILINLLPLTAETADILNANLFRQLPRGASIVNLARGGHLDEGSLLDALASGHLAHAILDVFREEPLPRDHPFWSHPRITALPHVAAETDMKTAAKIAADNIREFRGSRMPAPLVDRAKGY